MKQSSFNPPFTPAAFKSGSWAACLLLQLVLMLLLGIVLGEWRLCFKPAQF